MHPLDYAAHYENMNVPIYDGDKLQYWRKIYYHEYCLITGQDASGGVTWDSNHGSNQAMFDTLMGKIRDALTKTKTNPAPSLTVAVQTTDGELQEKTFTDWGTLWFFAKKALLGKCSPEEGQITLQLAVRFKLATADGLQDYCDKYLGLDCNGFVGNFIVHGWNGAAWDSEPGKDYLANQGIRHIITTNGREVKTMSELDAGGAYLMGLVDDDVPGKPIIDRFGSKGVGHLLVTEPGLRTITLYNNNIVPVLRGVESTGGVGLIDANVDLVSEPANGVFRVKRWSHPEMGPLSFRVYRLI